MTCDILTQYGELGSTQMQINESYIKLCKKIEGILCDVYQPQDSTSPVNTNSAEDYINFMLYSSDEISTAIFAKQIGKLNIFDADDRNQVDNFDNTLLNNQCNFHTYYKTECFEFIEDNMQV